LQGLGCGGEQPAGVLIAPRAVGVAPDEPGQPGLAEPAQGMRVGVTGGQDPQRREQRQVCAERGVPLRSQELQVGIQPGHDYVAALDQARAQFGGPAHRISGAQSLGGPQPAGMQ
jgi:hypothetical protein